MESIMKCSECGCEVTNVELRKEYVRQNALNHIHNKLNAYHEDIELNDWYNYGEIMINIVSDLVKGATTYNSGNKERVVDKLANMNDYKHSEIKLNALNDLCKLYYRTSIENEMTDDFTQEIWRAMKTLVSKKGENEYGK